MLLNRATVIITTQKLKKALIVVLNLAFSKQTIISHASVNHIKGAEDEEVKQSAASHGTGVLISASLRSVVKALKGADHLPLHCNDIMFYLHHKASESQ